MDFKIKVNHKNHGMYSADNTVTISGAYPDTMLTKLTAVYTADSTAPLSVDSGVSFGTFENVGVGTTNAGYLLIGDEIMDLQLPLQISWWNNHQRK